MSTEVFQKDKIEDYTKLSSTVSNYFKQASSFVAKYKNISIEEANKIVKEKVRQANIVNPEVTYYQKNENGDTVKVNDKLTNYIKEAVAADEVIVPSLTTYVHPKYKKSIHAEFLQENIDKRKEDKHKAFEYKQKGDTNLYLYYNTLQKTRKIFNNSLSGAYAAKGTILYNPSGHYSLTSTTRSVTSIGNAISDSMIASNKHFKDHEVTINYINTIVTLLDKDRYIKTISKYRLKKPTPEEVMDDILFSSRNYWSSEKYENIILEYLKTLDGVELAAITYINDLNSVRKYNDEFMRTFIGKLSKRVLKDDKDPITSINNAPEGVMNLVAHICSEDIKGMNVDYKKMVGTEKLHILSATANNIVDTLIEYSDFIKTFFITDIMPPTIAYIKDMLRDSVVLSDTDSTCSAYDTWAIWWNGGNSCDLKFNQEELAVTATIMTLVTRTIDHYLKLFTAKMNIAPDRREFIKMKNEFFWNIFTSTNVSKHYFANTMIQEGKVFPTPDLELKGVHLIASSVNKYIRDIAYDMIDYIHTTISSGNKISISKMAKTTADLERKIIKDIADGRSDIFKIDKIKEESAYKLDRLKSPYIHHMLWEEVFKDKYGNPGDPTYMVINIPTILKSRRVIDEYLAKIEDKSVAIKLDEFLKKYNKDSLGTFRVPLTIVSGKKLPIEVFKAVDFHKVVTNNVNILYLILESCGFFRKPTMLVSEMGY